MAKKLEYTCAALNQRLTATWVKVKVVQRGEMLWLQATLPPKPGNDRPNPHQQKISLRVSASEDGFRRAEQAARLLGAKLLSCSASKLH